jgi:hypothetical protein
MTPRGGLGRYRGLLHSLVERGFDIRPLGAWARGERHGSRVVLLRHDVDQQPRAAMRMAEIEAELGIRATWYARWRTADPGLIRSLQERDLEVGLHYESLSRLGHRLGADTPARLDELEPIAASYLAAEVRVFAHLFGRCPSICPHGDTGLPAARNADLLRHVPVEDLGVDFDARVVMAEAQRSGWAWLTDDSRAKARGMPPESDPVANGGDRLMLVIHPNNWMRAWRPFPGSRPVDTPPC